MSDINKETETATFGDIVREVPFSNEAEKSVVGAMFLERNCIPDVIERVKATDFYIERHAELYNAIIELYDMGKPVDLITLEEQLLLRGSLEKIGGIKFAVDVINSVPSPESVIYYADIVKDKAILRKLIKLADKISNSCYGGNKETDDILAEAQQGIIDISRDRFDKGLVPIGNYLDEEVEVLDKLSKNDGTVTGMPTGFKDIDKKTAGLHNSELIIIAGRPGMGKSSLALNIAQNAAVKYKKNVAIFSLEMPGLQVANRLLSAEAKISSERLKTGNLRDDDWGKLAEATEVLAKSGIYLDDTSSITVSEVAARARKLMLEKGLDLIVVDYLQLMDGADRKSRSGENRQQQITAITRNLKILANDLKIPVIALSQLSRSNDKEKREPVLSDLRDSGSIEQDADIVMFIHREGQYKPDIEQPNKTKCNFAKYRNGEPGEVNLTWLGEYTSFSDWSGMSE